MARWGKLMTGLGLVILAVSILFFAWGYWPARRETRIRPISGAAQAALPEKRALTLVFPPKIRAGDTGVVRLILGVETAGNLIPTAENGGEAAGRASLYETHKVIAESRFDIPGMDVRPTELISAPISQGQPAVFYWTLRPDAVGRYGGTIWLYIRTVDRLTGQESRETISAQIVEIDSVRFLGLKANQVRILGMVGIVIGLLLSLPFFESRIISFTRKKTKNVK